MTENDLIKNAHHHLKTLEIKRELLIKQLRHELLTHGKSEHFANLNDPIFQDFVLGCLVTGYREGAK